MKVTIGYKHGDVVYLKNDEMQSEYIIVAFILLPNQLLQLRISDAGTYYDVYEFEISTERNIVKATSAQGDDEE